LGRIRSQMLDAKGEGEALAPLEWVAPLDHAGTSSCSHRRSAIAAVVGDHQHEVTIRQIRPQCCHSGADTRFLVVRRDQYSQPWSRTAGSARRRVATYRASQALEQKDEARHREDDREENQHQERKVLEHGFLRLKTLSLQAATAADLSTQVREADLNASIAC